MNECMLDYKKLKFISGKTKQINATTVRNDLYQEVNFTKEDIKLAYTGKEYPSQYSYGNRQGSDMTPSGTVYMLTKVELPSLREVERTISVKRTSLNNYTVVVTDKKDMVVKSFSTIGKVNEYLLSLYHYKLPDNLLKPNTAAVKSNADDEDDNVNEDDDDCSNEDSDEDCDDD